MKQRESGLPFDDIRNLVQNLPELNADIANHTRQQLEVELSDFADLCEWYSACSGRSPAIHRPSLTLFAGTHSYENAMDGGASSDYLLQAITEISEGSAYVNRLCYQHDIGLKFFDLALQVPVEDITQEAALDEKSCAGTIAFGMEAIAGGADLLCVAALEQKPTLSAVAILTALGKLSHTDALSLLQAEADDISSNLESALALVKGHENNPLEVLRRLGGRETAAICGAILAARSQHIPVLIDGITAMASATVLHALQKNALDHVMLAQQPVNESLAKLVAETGLKPVIKTSLSAKAEVGIVLGAGVVKSACLLLQGRPKSN